MDTYKWAAWHAWMLNHGGTYIARNTFSAKKPLRKNKKTTRGPTKQSTKALKKINRWRTSPVLVSTVFLCVDHGLIGTPILFETMIFGGQYDEYQRRYETYDEALNGHNKILRQLWLNNYSQ